MGENGFGVLALSDYNAKLYRTNAASPKSYDISRVYRVLLPDGTIRDFDLIGHGPKQATAEPFSPPHP